MERFIYTSNDNITPFYYPVEVRPPLPLAPGPADRLCTQFDDLSLDRTQIPGWFREHEAEWEIWRNWANVTINVERMERYVLSGACAANLFTSFPCLAATLTFLVVGHCIALLQAEVSFGWQKSFRLEP